ncbi:RNA-binding protein [Polaromonas sp.]|uniref:RNA-binding protein n=1 Tax=Polaromonas sp. TaxID=1869339 RepID=UPI003C9BC212
MKAFALHPKMLSLQGVFYPTGYAFIMFPEAAQAEQAARELEDSGFPGQAITLLTPDAILREIGQVDGDSDVTLPSVGTEGATVHKYVDLAREGHHALMVHAPSEKDTERVMAVVRKHPFSYAQKYHMLAMEDLE